MFPPDKCATRLRYAPTARRHRQTGLLRQPQNSRGKEQKPKQPTLRDRWRRKVPRKVPQMFSEGSEVAMQESCFVYVMTAGKFIKVGIAADVDRRLGNVRSGALEVEVICKRRMPNRATALKAEKAIHSALAKHHHRREWFIVKPARAKAILSRHCARVRLAAALEARKPAAGKIRMSEYLEPKLPLALVGMSALEEWQWRKQRRAEYGTALERGELKLAGTEA